MAMTIQQAPQDVRIGLELLAPLSGDARKSAFQEAVRAAVGGEDFSPFGLLAVLGSHPRIAYLLEQDARIIEGYTIGEHTSAYLSQYEKHLADVPLPGPLTRADIRLFGSLHDIGKSLPDRKEDQHLASRAIIEELSPLLPWDDSQLAIIYSLLENDPLGKFLTSHITARASIEIRKQLQAVCDMRPLSIAELQEFQRHVHLRTPDEATDFSASAIAQDIGGRARLLGLTAHELFQLHLICYQADTSAYTYDAQAASGRRSYPGLEYLYELRTDFSLSQQPVLLQKGCPGGPLIFSSQVQDLVARLETAVMGLEDADVRRTNNRPCNTVQ